MAAGKGDSRNGRDMLIERRYGAGPEGADFAYDFIHRQRKDELITENWFNAMKCPAYGHLMGWCKDPERSQKEAARAKQLETGLAERERIRLNRLRFDWARRRPNPKLLEKYYTPPPELPQCRDYPACPMYPVHPEMSRWLYMGTRNDETGSGIYLKLRQYCPPETNLLFAALPLAPGLRCIRCGEYTDGVGSITPCLNYTESQHLKDCDNGAEFCVKYVTEASIVRDCVEKCEEREAWGTKIYCCSEDGCNGGGGLRASHASLFASLLLLLLLLPAVQRRLW